MKYSLLIGFILLSTIARTDSMEQKPKRSFNIKLRGLSQGSSTLPVPLATPGKRSSPTTDEALARNAIPSNFTNPRRNSSSGTSPRLPTNFNSKNSKSEEK